MKLTRPDLLTIGCLILKELDVINKNKEINDEGLYFEKAIKEYEEIYKKLLTLYQECEDQD